jgi:hypothetical protein
MHLDKLGTGCAGNCGVAKRQISDQLGVFSKERKGT